MKKILFMILVGISLFNSTAISGGVCTKYQSLIVSDAKTKTAYVGGGRGEVLDLLCKSQKGGVTNCIIDFREHLKRKYDLVLLNEPDQYGYYWSFDSNSLAENKTEEILNKLANKGYKTIKTDYSCDFKFEKGTKGNRVLRQ